MSLHLFKEIEKLKKMLLFLSSMVEENVKDAVKSIEKLDMQLAKNVIEKDKEIDQEEINVEEECLKILALHQPVAADLRFIITALKMNNDLERIGDLASNIAERAIDLASQDLQSAPYDFSPMGKKVEEMLKKSLDSLINLEVSKAQEVLLADDAVDEMHRLCYQDLCVKVEKTPSKINTLIHLLGVSRCLERIGDHATNIAEDVIYMAEGHIIRHHNQEEASK